MFEKYSEMVQKHPKVIIALWIVALLVAVPFASHAGDSLNYDMTSMGGFDSESSTGMDIVEEHFVGGVDTSVILAVPYADGDELKTVSDSLVGSGALQESVSKHFGEDASYSVMGAYGRDGSESGVFLIAFSFADGVSPIDEVGKVREAVADAKDASGLGLKTYVTGTAPIAYDTMKGADSDVAKIDPLSVLLILLLLGLFFWTLVTAMVPPMVVGCAYGVVLALMFALSAVMDIFYITKTIVLVSMLGAGCDYSVFIIARYREERKSGRSKEDALSESIRWAGESVFTSGLAVIIGFAVMSLCSFELVSTMAVVLAVGIVFAMLAALTLIPAVISVVGDKVFWPRTLESYKTGSRERSGVYGRFVGTGKRYFAWAGRFSVKHAKAIVVVAVLLTAPLAYVAATTEDSFDMISVMPDSEARQGVDAIVDNTDGGLLMPTYAVLELQSPIANVNKIGDGVGILTWTPEGMGYLAGLHGIGGRLTASDPNISYVLGPTSWAAVYTEARAAIAAQGVPEPSITPEMVNRAAVSALPDAVSLKLIAFFDTYGVWNAEPGTELGMIAPGVTVSGLVDYAVNIGAGLVSTDGGYVQMMAVVKGEPMSKESMDTIGNIRAQMSDLRASGDYAWIEDSWVTGTAAKLHDISEVVDGEFHYIELGVMLLIYILLLLVLGSYLTPVRSLATIMMSVVWTLGMVQLLFSGALATDVIWIVPIVLFVICLGLGMDYDILITTRIREGKLRGLSNDDAIVGAVERSGSIITLCGLIMGGTFLTLLLSGSAMLQEVGFALGFAILVDSLFVVPFVVPALMHLMGDWSWKGPSFLRKAGE